MERPTQRWSVAVPSSSGNTIPDIEPVEYAETLIKGETGWQLTILLHRDLLVNNPDIVLVCGTRVFRAVEEPAGG